MRVQAKRSWVLLTSFAACAGLAALPAFAVEPHATAGEPPPAVDTAASEDNRSAYLIKLLERSAQFRVRAMAAIALGQMEPSAAARRALTRALRDEYPAVRAAAATALGRIGDSDHAAALHELDRDPEEPVRHAARSSVAKLELKIEAFPLVLIHAATPVQLSAASGAGHL